MGLKWKSYTSLIFQQSMAFTPLHQWIFIANSMFTLFFSKCIPHYIYNIHMLVVVVLYQACQRPWWSPAKQRVLRGALTKNPAKFKFQWILVYGVKWKSYIIELSTKYDFHFTPSTNIHLNLNFRLFFLTVRVEGWGEIFSFEKIIIIILYGFKTLVLKCSEKRPRKKDLSGFLLSW